MAHGPTRKYREYYLRTPSGGCIEACAYFAGENLSRFDLHDLDLHACNFVNAKLRGTDFRGANLRSADLSSADLRGADLRGADLRGADLGYASLHGANLSGADLQGVQRLNPASVLCAAWDVLPKRLGALAMALDAANHPDGAAPFRRYVTTEGIACPYRTPTGRAWAPLVNFSPNYRHYDPKVKAPSVLTLATLLLDYARKIRVR